MKNNSVVFSPKDYEKNTNTYHLFKITDNYDNRSIYSQYLNRNFKGSNFLVATTGIDVGDNKNIKNITYFNTSTIKKDVILNVDCDYLNINAPNDNIRQYGGVNNLFIPSDMKGEYHEFGISSYIQVGGGTFYLEDNSSTDVFEIPVGSNVVTHQGEYATILARLNAPDVGAQSDVSLKEISEQDLGDVTDVKNLQTILDDGRYNFFRLTTEARDIVIKDNYITLNRSIFFDLNGRSISFMRGKDVEIENKELQEQKETYKTGILVTGQDESDSHDVTAF